MSHDASPTKAPPRFPCEYPLQRQNSPLLQSKGYNDCDTTVNSSLSSGSRRRVRFASTTEVHQVLHLQDLTVAERSHYWYSNGDFIAMKRQAVDVVRRMIRRQPVECSLGLEGRTLQAQEVRSSRLLETSTAVFFFGHNPTKCRKAYRAAGALQAADEATGRAHELRQHLLRGKMRKSTKKSNKLTGVVLAQPHSKPKMRLTPMIRI